METIEALRKKIAVTEDLREVVKTMKTLAAVSIRNYEKAVESLRQYSLTVEMGLQIVLRSHQENSLQPPPAAGGHLGAIIFGSELGMCGQFNEMVVSHALDEFQKFRGTEKPVHHRRWGPREPGCRRRRTWRGSGPLRESSSPWP